ncbi:uncharacterized protein LOC116162220 [Photinus pyralis]|uniref:uncharacterized protein LOC116162220 n=1 Tax=Photinus pyralis TaxID=7054 RepID=UPI001266FB36|nr:uncharacterized protein LOC116162220 [Photinus pyralis]
MIKKEVELDQERQRPTTEKVTPSLPAEEFPVDIDKIFPEDKFLQDRLRDFLNRLANDVKSFVRYYLGPLPPDQQGRVLGRLADQVGPYDQNVFLDPDMIRREVELDQERQRPTTEKVTPPLPAEELPVDIDKIFPEDRFLQDRIRDFLNRLAKDVKGFVRYYLGPLPPDQQGRVLGRLADQVGPYDQNVVLDPETIRKEIELDQRPTTTELATPPPPVEELPVDVEKIYPKDRFLQDRLRDFLNRLAKDSKSFVHYYVGPLPPDQQGRVLTRLADQTDPYEQNVALDPDTIKKEIELDEERQRPSPPVEKLPLDADKIFPHDKDLQNKLRDFLNRLSKDAKSFVHYYLGPLPPDQQGRVLSRLADQVDPYAQDVHLDPDTIRKEIELDQERQRPPPPVDELPVDIDKIFPQDRDLQNRLRDFLNRLTKDTKSFVRYYLSPLPPDQQGRVLARLANGVDPYDQNVVLDPETIRKAIEADNRPEGSGTEVPHVDLPLDVDRIYPHNKVLQNVVKDFLERLSDYSKNLVRMYLGNLPPKQQGRVLLRLSAPIDSSEKDIVLDSDIIRKEIGLDKGGKKVPETTAEPPVDVERIHPQSKELQNKTKQFLDRLTKDSSNLVRQHLGDLSPAQQGRVLDLLSDPIDPRQENVTLDSYTIMKAIDIDNENFKEHYKADRPPVNVEKIYPENLDLQDKVRDFLDQLSKDSQDLVGEYLGNRTSEQQGRVLLELAKPINPVLNNVTLDAETIKKAIELDERNQSKSTEEVPTTAPTTDTTPKMTSSAKTPSPHTLENLFPAKPDIQEHVEKFWYNLTPASQTTLRNSVCNLKPEKQRRILVYLTRVSEARTNQNGEKMMLHNDSVEKVVLMDDKGELGEAQKIIDDGKWPDEPLDDGSIDGSGSSGRIVHVACLSILAVVWLIV